MLRFALLLLLFAGCVKVPTPVPPRPDPTPEVEPVGHAVRVVIWRETNLARVPEGQLEQYFGPELHGWFKAHGVGYRIWDQNVVISPDTPLEWRKAAEARPPHVPWVIATNGKTTIDQPLPATPAETIKLLEPLL